ncbi:MAG TPA: hypothetical protein VFG50_11420 [Rhodothermales bacterium]|nr:hypothetical protein [Rhodothermales bacterium]
MEKVLDKQQVLAQLDARSEEITRRLDAIQQEVSTTGQSVRTAVSDNPLLSVSGAVAAGLLVGLLFGGSKKSPKRKGGNAEQRYRALIDEYIQSIVEEADGAARSGKDSMKAVRRALRDRVPLIVYSNAGANPQRGFVGEGFDLAYKTALGFAVKFGIDFLASKLKLTALAEQLQAEDGASATPSVAAVVSED